MISNRVRWSLAITISTLAVIGVAASATFYVRPLMHDRFLDFPAVVALHVVLGGVYLALAPFQFVTRIRTRWPEYHRQVGRLLVAIGLVAGASGLFMAWIIPFAGWPERIILGFFGLLFLTSTAKGFFAIRAGQVTAHREWMIRAFAIGLAIATDRLIIVAIIFLMLGNPTGEPNTGADRSDRTHRVHHRLHAARPAGGGLDPHHPTARRSAGPRPFAGRRRGHGDGPLARHSVSCSEGGHERARPLSPTRVMRSEPDRPSPAKENEMEQRPRVGVGVLLRCDGKVLLGKRRGSHGERAWAPPGGHLEY